MRLGRPVQPSRMTPPAGSGASVERKNGVLCVASGLAVLIDKSRLEGRDLSGEHAQSQAFTHPETWYRPC
jgi:hypothetical protein